MKHLKRLILLIPLLIVLWMYVQAHLVHVEYTTVYLKDLPAAFDGTTLLYVSDPLIASASDADHTRKVIRELASAQPDLLLLGGDMSDIRLWDTLRCLGSESKLRTVTARSQARANEFLASLADVNFPLGKFAITGETDAENLSVATAMGAGGIRLINDRTAVIEKDGARLIIAGVDADPYAVAGAVSAGDCCILLCHNPDSLPQLFTVDAQGGGGWIDLALAGHTRGGQIRISSLAPMNDSAYGLKHITGWQEQIGAHALTSNGLGTHLLPLRLGAPAQVHVITLRQSLPAQ